MDTTFTHKNKNNRTDIVDEVMMYPQGNEIIVLMYECYRESISKFNIK